MTEFYVHIIIMSLVASSMLTILMLTKRVTQKWFSATWHYYSSLFLFLLFVVPVYVWFQMSTPANPAVSIPTGNEVGATLVNYVSIVLLVGSILFFSVYLFRIVKMTRLLRTTCEESFDETHLIALAYAKKTLKIKRKVTIYLSPYMTTPFIYGIFKPKIVLPSFDFSDEELKHIFLHELTHYKRGDLWTKPLLSIIQSVHWFNPIVHLARREIDRFGEYACDESITKQMNRDERTRYCELLLNVLWNVVDQKHGHYAAMSRIAKAWKEE
ncbi:M56 family metallopeptidase [Geomicrobium sp. JCM 19039]|uniref:M56 family metallopeptidase n=1 Tax=Geomicrobium sp. JCM 19039 TaxID=1460636 RepID=UPI00045F4D92|nr:M56 family metallopeptidase [Geomicrobium sp. JCM 19039]GAK13671.1 regulatory sensor-transducer, BlaR1/MecR1 family [Geomicrobium sp. JCM 19039]